MKIFHSKYCGSFLVRHVKLLFNEKVPTENRQHKIQFELNEVGIYAYLLIYNGN